MTSQIAIRVAARFAKSFPSKKELDKYLKEHPKAVKTKHWFEETNATPQGSKSTQEILAKIERPKGWRSDKDMLWFEAGLDKFAKEVKSVSPKGSLVMGTDHGIVAAKEGSDERKYWHDVLVPAVEKHIEDAIKKGKTVTYIAETERRFSPEELKSGGYKNPDGSDWSANDEQFQMAVRLKKKFGERVKVVNWDDEETEMVAGSKTVKKLYEMTGDKQLVHAALVAGTAGQGEDLEGLRKDGLLTPETEDYLERAYGIKVKGKKSLTKREQQKLYEMAFPQDFDKPKTPFAAVFDVQNSLRQKRMIEKIQDAEKAGGVAVVTPGASHAWNLKPVISSLGVVKDASLDVQAASLVTPNQLKYIRTLLKQRKVPEPPGLDKWTALNASKLIGGLQDRRLTPTFDPNGKFRGWETKKANLAERVAAPKRRPAVPPSKKTLEEVVRKAVESTVGSAMGKLKGLESLTPVSVSGRASFSDGVHPSRAWGSTGYSFTIQFPTKVLTKGVFQVTLDEHDLKESLLDEDRDGVLEKTDPASIAAAVQAVDVANILERGLEDAVEVPKDVRGLPEDVFESITDAASQKVEQSISAWTEDEPELELSEYPDVYLRWRIQRGNVEYGRPAQAGNVWRIPVKVLWDVKPDAWTLDNHPLPGDWNRMRLASSSMTERVAARYKSKKKVKTQDGDDMIVYEYSDRQVANRNRHKAEQIAKLEKAMGSLRSKVKRDIRSDDPGTALTALAVALMDHTFERVGNDTSAKEGHYGVTGWQRKHVSFGRGKATIKYVGKSGVEQVKTVSDASLVKALRNAYEASEGDDACLFCHDSGKVDASKINAYLKSFGVTAKDIRGMHANREMRERLTAIRKGKLPLDPKERTKQLKDEFKKALEETAAAVGHEAATLRSQYLVPGLEDTYLKNGTIEKSKMARVAFGPHAELLVTDLIEFPSTSKPGKMNKLYPGTVLDPITKVKDITVYQPSGWYAQVPFEDVPKDKVLNLRNFFKDVVKLLHGSFAVPRRHREFVMMLPDKTVLVYFDSSRDNWAEVRPDEGEDYEVKLTVSDFVSPKAFIRKILT